MFVCRRCNMIPAQFFPKGKVFIKRLSVSRARDHNQRCGAGRLDLTVVVETFCAAAESVGKDPLELISLGPFKAVMRHAMGFLGNELFVALNEGIRDILEKGGTSDRFTERADLWRYFSARKLQRCENFLLNTCIRIEVQFEWGWGSSQLYFFSLGGGAQSGNNQSRLEWSSWRWRQDILRKHWSL